MIDPKSMILFAKTVELGGVRAASRNLSVPKTTISRCIAELEEALGVRLFERSPRRLLLTELGHVFLQNCQRIAQEVDEAETAVGDFKGATRGRLRVACPVTFGRSLLSPVLPRFLLMYPEIRMELELTNRKVDSFEEGFDLVIRLGPLDDSTFIAKDLGALTFVLCASPHYLSENQVPRHPNDLAEHKVIDFFDGAQHHVWSFARGSEKISVEVCARLNANDPMVRRDAAVAGIGIVLLPKWMFQTDSKSRKLVELLPDWNPTMSTRIFALYPSRRSVTAKSRAFIDFLQREMRKTLRNE